MDENNLGKFQVRFLLHQTLLDQNKYQVYYLLTNYDSKLNF